MTAVRPVLDAYLELNVILALSALVWLAAGVVLARTPLRFAYVAQLRALKVLFVCVMLSPLLAIGAATLVQAVWPGRAVTFGDIAVAAYLRGDIAIPAIQFEVLLNTRQRWVDVILSGESTLLTLVVSGLAAMALLLALRTVLAALAIRNMVRSSFLWRRSATVDVRLSDTISVPFAVRGLFRRHVILPSHLLDKPRDMRFAIAHEFQHVRAGDIEWELALEFMRPLFFWNPAYLILKYQFDRLRELGCDQSVVARNVFDVRDYTTCLLDYCSRTASAGQPGVLNVALVNGSKAKRVLRQRVLALADGPAVQHSAPVLFLALALTFVTVLSAGSVTIRKTDDWSHDRLMLSAVVNLERLAKINQGN
ncbi:M56 family metallopeptidase [Ruegeria sp. HKCCD8929]|uniref:M56 family metallopeptidase n=1 Tax=Ruegeria sp. HKCCD8929 TaxID=2683006 RepID=UPI0014889D54|nr:M56 family metallopeptidase [Ruegeria sp. HKCCD8929]